MQSRTVTSLPVTEMTVGPEWDGHQGNWDSNRVFPINMIVIHTMDGTVASANARFNDPASCVSATYGIGLDGKKYHWVDEDKVAYANGDYAINQSAISIEHEDGGDYNGVRPDVLYSSSAELVADICKFYSIPCDRVHIKKHSEVSDAPTGCPDALDIDRIVNEANQILNPAPSAPTINDQTEINIGVDSHGHDWGVMQVQAIRSQLGDDFAKVQSLTQTVNTDNTTIQSDQAEIKQLQSTPTEQSPVAPPALNQTINSTDQASITPVTPEIPSETPQTVTISTGGLLSKIKAFFASFKL